MPCGAIDLSSICPAWVGLSPQSSEPLAITSVSDRPPVQHVRTPPLERRPNPILIGTKELARLLDVSITTIKRYDELGKIPEPIWIGSAKRWHLKEIRAWVKAKGPHRDVWNARFPNRVSLPTPEPTNPAE